MNIYLQFTTKGARPLLRKNPRLGDHPDLENYECEGAPATLYCTTAEREDFLRDTAGEEFEADVLPADQFARFANWLTKECRLILDSATTKPGAREGHQELVIRLAQRTLSLPAVTRALAKYDDMKWHDTDARDAGLAAREVLAEFQQPNASQPR